MRLFSKLAVAALAAGLLVVPAATAAPVGKSADAPTAGMAGSDVVVLVYPSIVNNPMVRARAALNRAFRYADDNQPDKATTALNITRQQLKKAWVGEKYLIDTQPPPVVEDGMIADDPVAGASPYASAEDTGAALFLLQHDATVMSAALLGTKNVALRNAARATIASAQTQRNTAVAYIHQVAPPPPPEDGISADDTVASTWDTVMPAVLPYLDDEIQLFTQTLKADGALAPLTRTAFTNALTRAQATKTTINTYWPPVPPEA
jgi:hypothetical protein